MNAALRNPFAVAGAIVASAAALALPASASAAVTVDASGDPITFTGDAADDNLVLSVSGRQDRAQPARGPGLCLGHRPRPGHRRTPRTATWRAPTS